MSACLHSHIDVSVLILTFNQERYVRSALASVLCQVTSYAIEIVVADDGSEDGTVSAIEEMRNETDVSIIIVSGRNVGVMRNFFRAYQHCRGRFIAFLEGDDFWRDAAKIEKQCQALEVHKGASMCFHDFEFVDEAGTSLGSPEIQARNLTMTQLQHGRFVHLNTILCWNVIGDIEQEAVNVLQGDQFIIARLGCAGWGLHLEDVQPSAYRIHDGGAWSPLSEAKKHSRAIETFYWIAEYFARTGRGQLDAFYRHRIFQILCKRRVCSPSLRSGLWALFSPVLYRLYTFRRRLRS